MAVNPNLVLVGFDLVRNDDILFIFPCLFGWYSLLPIEDRSTDEHGNENRHHIC